MSTNPGKYEAVKNFWVLRAAKFLMALAVGIVEVANVYVNGPTWFYALAAGVGAALVYLVPNAPKYVDPRPEK